MRRVLFNQVARDELLDAIDWYDSRRFGLGAVLADDLNGLLGRIAADPLQFPLVLTDLRRALLRRFPYSVIFRITSEKIQVVAFFHARRSPRQWRGR